MNDFVWLVIGDDGGAHDPAPVLSIWTTESGAEAEMLRLRALNLGGYANPREILEVPMNKPGSAPLNW